MRIFLKALSLLVFSFFLRNCSSSKVAFGKIEKKYDPDSLKSIAKISEIKKMDFADFQEGTFQKNNLKLNYRLLSPKKISPNKKYPLVLVFHGSGAIGDDNKKQMGVLSKIWLLPENRENFPAFVLAPQFPVRSTNYHLDENLKVPVSQANEYLDLLLSKIDSIKNANPNIDKERIYVMGFSMGGGTTMNAISKRPDLFAAAINISGISEFDKIAQISKIPIWIVHGMLDTDNLPKSNIKFFEEFSKVGKAAFWKYQDKWHNNIMTEEIVETVPKWLFKQKKNQ